ncbi:hypothetical protein KMB31_28570, partial [Streptomyces sp. CYG21]|nr:hypothetical protein [Streptomyces sp. CYG21]
MNDPIRYARSKPYEVSSSSPREQPVVRLLPSPFLPPRPPPGDRRAYGCAPRPDPRPELRHRGPVQRVLVHQLPVQVLHQRGVQQPVVLRCGTTNAAASASETYTITPHWPGWSSRP